MKDNDTSKVVYHHDGVYLMYTRNGGFFRVHEEDFIDQDEAQELLKELVQSRIRSVQKRQSWRGCTRHA